VAGTDELIAKTPALANPGTETDISRQDAHCPLWEAKRTLLGERVMSAPDSKRT